MSATLARFLAADAALDALLDATAARCTLKQERELIRLTREHADAFNALSPAELAAFTDDTATLEAHYN